MRSRTLVALSCACSLFLAGCWDAFRLRDATFVYGLGFELSEKGTLHGTYVIQKVRNANQGGGERVSDVITGDGASVFDSSRSADLKVAGALQFRNIKLLMISKELAKQDLFSLLEPILRNRGTPLTMKVTLAEGKVSELLKIDKVGLQETVEFLMKQIKAGEEYTHFPKSSLQDVMTLMTDDGRDFALPVFKVAGNRIEDSALALFHGTQFTGETLSIPDSTLLSLLNGEKGKLALLTQKWEKAVLSLFVKRLSNRMDISERDDEIVVRVVSKLKVTLAEGIKRLPDEEKQALEQSLSEALTKRAEDLMKKIQKANCDFLGIGRELNAYHHDLWTKLDWEKEYPRIKIEPQVQLEIINTGIMN